MDFVVGKPQTHGVSHIENAFRTSFADFVNDFFAVRGQGRQTVLTGFKTAQRLLERLLEGRPDRHHFTHGLHLRGETVIGLRELLKGKTRDLGDNVVNRRLKGRGRSAPGDVVFEFVKRVAHRKFGGDLGNREPRCLGGQGRGARDTRIHFDDNQTPVFGVHGKLHVAAARIHTDFTQHRNRRVTHDLVLAVREGLRRSHRNRVTRMNAHGVEVFDGADDDAVIRLIAHDFHLVLFPPEKRLFDEKFVRRGRRETTLADFHEFLHVVGNAAAGAAERKGRADHRGKAHALLNSQRLRHVVGNPRARGLKPDAGHRFLKALTVFGLIDRFGRSADEFHIVLFKNALFVQFHREV